MGEHEPLDANIIYVLKRYKNYLVEPYKWSDEELLNEYEATKEMKALLQEAMRREIEELEDLVAVKTAVIRNLDERQAAIDRRTLETIASLLNGDDNQVEVVKNYVRNKLKVVNQPSNKEQV